MSRVVSHNLSHMTEQCAWWVLSGAVGGGIHTASRHDEATRHASMRLLRHSQQSLPHTLLRPVCLLCLARPSTSARVDVRDLPESCHAPQRVNMHSDEQDFEGQNVESESGTANKALHNDHTSPVDSAGAGTLGNAYVILLVASFTFLSASLYSAVLSPGTRTRSFTYRGASWPGTSPTSETHQVPSALGAAILCVRPCWAL
eukprot:169238-Rhodomonas_salina.4